MSRYEHLDKLIEKLDNSPSFRYSTNSKELKGILSQLTDHMYVELVGHKHSNVGDGNDMFSVDVSFQFTLSRQELKDLP